jgi:signal recognition particle receptor subunit beta
LTHSTGICIGLGLIFVIDSTDEDRLIVAREELMHLFSQIDRSSTMSIVVAANKQDLSGE